MKTKLLTKCLLGGALVATTVAHAGFFEFKEDSQLSPLQKNMLKVLFVDKAVQGISSMVSTFQTTVLQEIVTEYKDALLAGGSKSLEDIILSYLFEASRKKKDLRAILKYDAALTEDLKNADTIFEEAITGDKDGLFNGIIRETLKAYKKCIASDDTDDKTQLTEAYNVLWDTVVSAWSTDFTEEFWDDIMEQYPNSQLGTLLTSLRAADGKNACEKIASLLGAIIKKEIEKTAEGCCCSCCGPCCKKTMEITEQSAKFIIKILPTVLQLVVTIMSTTAA